MRGARRRRRPPRNAAIDLTAIRVGHLDGDWLDPRLAYVRVRGHGPEGAVLVRPDRVVAWRSTGGSPTPEAVLTDAFDRVLCRA